MSTPPPPARGARLVAHALDGVQWRGALLWGLDLSGASLRGADLAYALLVDVRDVGADWQGVNLHRALSLCIDAPPLALRGAADAPMTLDAAALPADPTQREAWITRCAATLSRLCDPQGAPHSAPAAARVTAEPDPEAALAALLDEAPACPPLWILLAERWVSLGDLGAARWAYDQSLAHDPTSLVALIGAARCDAALTGPAQAVRRLDQAALTPHLPPASQRLLQQHALTLLCASPATAPLALTRAERLLRAQDDDPFTRIKHAEAAYLTGRYDVALASLQRAHQLNPSDDTTLRMMAEVCLLGLNMPHEAWRLLDRYLARHPHDPDALTLRTHAAGALLQARSQDPTRDAALALPDPSNTPCVEVFALERAGDPHAALRAHAALPPSARASLPMRHCAARAHIALATPADLQSALTLLTPNTPDVPPHPEALALRALIDGAASAATPAPTATSATHSPPISPLDARQGDAHPAPLKAHPTVRAALRALCAQGRWHPDPACDPTDDHAPIPWHDLQLTTAGTGALITRDRQGPWLIELLHTPTQRDAFTRSRTARAALLSQTLNDAEAAAASTPIDTGGGLWCVATPWRPLAPDGAWDTQRWLRALASLYTLHADPNDAPLPWDDLSADLHPWREPPGQTWPQSPAFLALRHWLERTLGPDWPHADPWHSLRTISTSEGWGIEWLPPSASLGGAPLPIALGWWRAPQTLRVLDALRLHLLTCADPLEAFGYVPLDPSWRAALSASTPPTYLPTLPAALAALTASRAMRTHRTCTLAQSWLGPEARLHSTQHVLRAARVLEWIARGGAHHLP